MNSEIRFVSLCGMLGYGYPTDSLERGLAAQPQFLAVDNGSTDPGPYYLGSGLGFVKDLQIKRDLEPALLAACGNRIPLIVGSAGGAGAQPHLDHFVELLLELAHKHGLHFRLAAIHADIAPATVLQRLEQGRVQPCGPVHELTPGHLEGVDNLVAQMGTGPIIAALQGGADVVIAGRCCDTALFAALPIMQGFDAGLALHCAKIAECGALCARPASAADCLIGTISGKHFLVEPASPRRRCTPASVMAHSLYEQPNPDCFFEPEGKIDLTGSVFEQVSEHTVRVSNTRLIPAEKQTVKLEGARRVGFRAITIAGVRDPLIIENLDTIEAQVHETVAASLAGHVPEGCFSLRFIRYGVDAVPLGPLPPDPVRPREVGLVIEAVGPDQEIADAVLSLARSTALHQSFPGRKTTAGNLAFPFSPSDFQGGAVYEFSVYHLMEVEDECELFPVTFTDV